MTNEMHLYTFGSDPFQLQWGDVTVFVHQGAPPIQVTPAPPETTTISTPSKLGGSYQNYIIAPSTSDDVLEILDSSGAESINLGVELGGSSLSEGETQEDQSEYAQQLLVGAQVAALHEGLTSYGDQHHVIVHVIHDPTGQFSG